MNITADLEYRRIFDFDLVPEHLFEQVPDRNYDVENIYKWGPLFMSSPFNWLFGLYNGEPQMHGVLWCTIDPVVENLCVNILSVDKEYQKPNGEIVKNTIKFLKDLAAKSGLKQTILWATSRPKAFERYGCKRFNRTIIEG